jgi:murein DD-endopeptidase MepM/ murein hydrolase activator NlpD
LNRPPQLIKSALAVAATFAGQHRRAIATTALVALAGFGITAFGIAPMAPDAAELPQRWISEPLEPVGLGEQALALLQQDLTLWRSDVSRGNDTAEALLRRLGVADPQAAVFVRNDPLARKLLSGRGKMLQARVAADGKLLELVARYPAENSAESPELSKTHFSRLTLRRSAGGATPAFESRTQLGTLTTQVRLASGTIQSSLFAATDEARLPDAVAAQLAEIFATDIDFHRELRKGDMFSVVYEGLSADDQPVTWGEGAGRILAAEFVNNKRVHHALWFAAANGARGGYFSIDGSSKKRSFLASPMEFSRVTSGFATRFHPLLQSWRQHLGVDYAAPSGTTVRVVGDGVVEFAGWQNGYGKVVEVRHGNERSTLYAHLSAMQVKKGDKVSQGQHIGAVGSTGWSTGPHLHFEFRVRGVHQDPLLVAKASESLQLDAASRVRFTELTQTLQRKLDIAETLAAGAGGRVARFE